MAIVAESTTSNRPSPRQNGVISASATAAACAGVVSSRRGRSARRAAAALGWRPKVSFAELVAMMVDSDLDLAARELSLRDNGHAAVHVG